MQQIIRFTVHERVFLGYRGCLFIVCMDELATCILWSYFVEGTGDSPKTSKRTKRTGFKFVDEAIFLRFGFVAKTPLLANTESIVWLCPVCIPQSLMDIYYPIYHRLNGCKGNP